MTNVNIARAEGLLAHEMSELTTHVVNLDYLRQRVPPRCRTRRF
jgi:hypothetical protein